MNSKNYKYIRFSLEDIYTNHGEIGLIGLSYKKNDIEIVHFLLSCRVLGRGIEYSMFNYIIDQTRCFPFKNLSSYYSINKNSEPASNFYSDVGMKIVKKTKQRIDFNANIPNYDKRKIKWIEQKEIL
jgi:predicted enzyme involved in methoxymalonyl-ACP biosynthesis